MPDIPDKTAWAGWADVSGEGESAYASFGVRLLGLSPVYTDPELYSSTLIRDCHALMS